jgi:DNA polymerase (family 10)
MTALTKRGKTVVNLAKIIVRTLKPYCKRIQIAGSIRRKESNPHDADIVLIPKDREKLEKIMAKKGKFVQGGEHESTWRVNGIKIEFYYTISEEWGAALLAYSSKPGSGIGLRMVAKKKGFKLNNHGLFKGKRKIAGKTEREIYKTLRRPYKEPEER